MPTLDAAAADEMLRAIILDDVARQDPAAAYRRFHAELPTWRSDTGSTVLCRYEDALEHLRNPRWGRPEPDMELPAGFAGAPRRDRSDTHAMLLLNPPDHTRIRGLVSRAFTPRRVEELRPRLGVLLDSLLDPLVDRLEGGDVVDLLAELAVPFPVAVISELLGVPQDETVRFIGLARDATSLIDAAADEEANARGIAAVTEMAIYFVGLIEEKRHRPDDGLLSALIEVEAEGDRLSLEELVANTILLYAAGFETTSNLIANGVWALLRFPDQMQRLVAEPSLVPAAVWEVLRYDSPVQLNARTLLADGELLGEPAERGTQVIVLQGAANHDPDVYDHPERFDVARFAGGEVATPLSFGWGAHHCLGAHLARAEAEVVLERIVVRFPGLRSSGTAPRYRPSFTLRGLEALPVSGR